MILRDRIVELRRVDTVKLRENAGNWRTHPQAQRDALSGLLSEVGIADALLAYPSARHEGALTLIDGHLRKEDYPGVWPVLVLDLSDEEADLLLATLDPLAAMAGAAEEQLAALLVSIPPQEAGLQAALDDLARRARLALGAPDGPLPSAPEPQLDRGEELQQQWGTALATVMADTGQRGADRISAANALLTWSATRQRRHIYRCDRGGAGSDRGGTAQRGRARLAVSYR